MPPADEIKNALDTLPGGRASFPANPALEKPLPNSLDRGVCPAPWSKSEALERLGEDAELLREMCGIFLEQSASLLEQLRQAVAGRHVDAMLRAAHTLKGEVSYFAAPAATAAARRLEDIAHSREISQAPEALVLLERELELLCRSIREFMEVKP